MSGTPTWPWVLAFSLAPIVVAMSAFQLTIRQGRIIKRAPRRTLNLQFPILDMNVLITFHVKTN